MPTDALLAELSDQELFREIERLRRALDDAADLDDAERAELEEKLAALEAEQGKSYVPPDDLWDDEVFAHEMEKLGLQRSEDPAAGGWEEIPPPEPGSEWNPDQSNYERISNALRILVASGKLSQDFIDA